MDISCPRCGQSAEPAGHEDARAFFRCPTCDRVWAVHISALSDRFARPVPRVLVAEDSPEMLGLMSAWLEDEGCIVIAVGSGGAAIEATVAHVPHAAFVDIMIPKPDGYELSELLVRRYRLPVVLMTGMTTPDARRVADSGALRLLKKPFTREVVIDALALALEHRRLADNSGHVAAAG